MIFHCWHIYSDTLQGWYDGREGWTDTLTDAAQYDSAEEAENVREQIEEQPESADNVIWTMGCLCST